MRGGRGRERGWGGRGREKQQSPGAEHEVQNMKKGPERALQVNVGHRQGWRELCEKLDLMECGGCEVQIKVGLMSGEGMASWFTQSSTVCSHMAEGVREADEVASVRP